MEVNHIVGLRIVLNISDYMNTFDNIKVTFPNDLTIAYVRVSGTNPLDDTKHTVTGQVLNVVLKSN